jgi:hypothetical protein
MSFVAMLILNVRIGRGNSLSRHENINEAIHPATERLRLFLTEILGRLVRSSLLNADDYLALL